MHKIPTRLRGTNFCTSSECFAPSFVRQLNGPKCTQMVQNATKQEFRVRWGGSGAFVAQNSDATSWHELLHKFGLFCSEFGKETKWFQMVRNAPKREFRFQWGGSGAFVAKNFTNFVLVRNVWPLVPFGNFTIPNAPKWYETHQNMSLGSNGVDQVRSLQIIPTRLRGTNFCTSSECFAPSLVRKPSGPKWYETHQNLSLGSNGVNRVRSS